MVAAHVNDLGSTLSSPEGSLYDGLRIAGKGDDGAVGPLSGVYV
jgi:hypothetical protein